MTNLQFIKEITAGDCPDWVVEQLAMELDRLEHDLLIARRQANAYRLEVLGVELELAKVLSAYAEDLNNVRGNANWYRLSDEDKMAEEQELLAVIRLRESNRAYEPKGSSAKEGEK